MAKKKKHPNKNFNKPKLNPQKAAQIANEAIEFCRSGDYKSGIRMFKKAEERAGSNDQISINLAIAYHAIADFAHARKYYAKAIALKSQHALKVLQNGINEMSMGKLDSAECCIMAVSEVEPDNITARLANGSLLLRRGQIQDGAAILRDVYRKDPKMTSAIAELSEFSELTPEDIAMVQENISKGLGARNNDKFLFLAFGRAYDLYGDYARAYDFFSKANTEFARESQISCYQAANDLEGHYETVLNSVTSEFMNRFSASKDIGKELVFIVGLPRSGLHTAAYLLQESGKAVIAGEMNWCNQKIYQMLQASQNDFAGMLNKITVETLQTLTADYYRLVTGLLSSGKSVINCKTSNFVNIWLIRLLFPQAKIVYAKRNLDDLALDIFFSYNPGMEYLNDLLSIGKYCKVQQKLMEYWNRLFPEDIIYFDYDEFIARPSETYKNLVFDLYGSAGAELEFKSVAKPTLNVKEIYAPEKRLSEKYAEFTSGLQGVLHPDEAEFSLNFTNFDTAGVESPSPEKLNFGFEDSADKNESGGSDGFKLNF